MIPGRPLTLVRRDESKEDFSLTYMRSDPLDESPTKDLLLRTAKLGKR